MSINEPDVQICAHIWEKKFFLSLFFARYKRPTVLHMHTLRTHLHSSPTGRLDPMTSGVEPLFSTNRAIARDQELKSNNFNIHIRWMWYFDTDIRTQIQCGYFAGILIHQWLSASVVDAVCCVDSTKYLLELEYTQVINISTTTTERAVTCRSSRQRRPYDCCPCAVQRYFKYTIRSLGKTLAARRQATRQSPCPPRCTCPHFSCSATLKIAVQTPKKPPTGCNVVVVKWVHCALMTSIFALFIFLF